MPTNFISLAEAKTLTTNYRNVKEVILDPQFRGRNVLPVCETFPRAAFDTVLAKPGCTGLRIYYAMDGANLVKLVIVGVDDQNQDMLSGTSSGRVNENAVGDEIIDQSTRCPTNCPPSSPLNG